MIFRRFRTSISQFSRLTQFIVLLIGTIAIANTQPTQVAQFNVYGQQQEVQMEAVSADPGEVLENNSQPAGSEQERVEIITFTRPDCVHCIEQAAFFAELEQQRDDFYITDIDISLPENQQVWDEVTTTKNIPKATPLTVINGAIIQGFGTADTTGVVMEQKIEQALRAGQRISLEEFLTMDQAEVEKVAGGVCEEECVVEPEPLLINIPFIGAVNVRQYSLPIMAALLGFVDGFNPCAMWVLVSFLIILAQIGDKRKMWLFAGTFVLAEAIMYFLILNVWYTTWDFVGLDKIVTPIVGLVALGSGLFFLWEAWTNDGTCAVTDSDQKAKTQQRLQKLVTSKFSFTVFLGILGLALSVNIIEFACSIGIPQAFTKILELQGFTFVQSLPYTLLYILMYMVDDFIVFGIALYSFDKIGVTTKYTRASQIIGGVVMLVLGGLLLFAPEVLKML